MGTGGVCVRTDGPTLMHVLSALFLAMMTVNVRMYSIYTNSYVYYKTSVYTLYML